MLIWITQGNISFPAIFIYERSISEVLIFVCQGRWNACPISQFTLGRCIRLVLLIQVYRPKTSLCLTGSPTTELSCYFWAFGILCNPNLGRRLPSRLLRLSWSLRLQFLSSKLCWFTWFGPWFPFLGHLNKTWFQVLALPDLDHLLNKVANSII